MPLWWGEDEDKVFEQAHEQALGFANKYAEDMDSANSASDAERIRQEYADSLRQLTDESGIDFTKYIPR